MLLALISVNRLHADENVTAYWVVPGKDAVVLITPEGESISLQIVRTLDPALLDINNPDKTLRSQPLSNKILGEGFTRNGDKWVDGKIYDPSSGKSYHATIQSRDQHHLIVRGYIAVPALGQSQTWTRLDLFREKMLDLISKPKDFSLAAEHK